MTVDELSRRTGVAANTIRYYTRIGLLRPDRHPSNSYRLYGEKDLKRLDFVGKAKWLGLSLSEIQGLIRKAELGGTTCATVRAIVTQRAADVSRQIAGLQELERELVGALQAWRNQPDTPQRADSICPLIESYVPDHRVARGRVLGRGVRFSSRAASAFFEAGAAEASD